MTYSVNEILSIAHDLRNEDDVAGLLHLIVVMLAAQTGYTGRVTIEREDGFEPYKVGMGDNK
jgi:hypothetical protein